jgi:hypothetical protein
MTPPSATYRRLLALAGCLATLAAAGCGSDDEGDQGAPIPAAQAQALQTRLGEIQRRFDFGDGACADIQDDSKPAIEQLLAAIPQTVSADVRSTLRDGFDRLFSLSQEQCDEQQGQQTETTTTETQTETVETVTEPETVPTTPTETETTPTETETTPTTPEDDDPSEENSGSGQGGGVAPEDGQ